ncbi:hypothetical protein FHU10_0049 [Serratia fonticola]|uniref:Uncharacterized protein n=1 Tax=Serratia fonticola TaxID=47917 RepID=A0A542D4W4_SERFO|nr:hypothetical protein [Serratia fonticola]TQI79848.1 hypothetical protein FHU09_2400 [Serratia fonticola]TQI98127.1 hypothetical protein FHU11_3647 [Serratia fonticola]TVZ67655.1 hypothetical protein FHU10_0049 [Serratia fonticola]
MEKLKSVDRLLLESYFTKGEIKKIKSNANFFQLDILDSVRDIGRRTLRASIILGVILTIFTIGTVSKDGVFGFGIIVLMCFIVVIPSYFLTPMRLYIKSLHFFLKDRRNEKMQMRN